MKNLVSFYRTPGLKKYLPGIAWLFVIVVLLLLPSRDLPQQASWMDKIHFDKMVHAGLFGSLVFLWLFPVYISVKSLKTRRWLTFLLIAGVVLFGIASEWLQYYFTADRHFDLEDWAADVGGALLGIGFTHLVATGINRRFPRQVVSP